MWSGTDAQKAKLAEVRSNLATAIAEANKALHGVLAESQPPPLCGGGTT